MPLDLPRLDGSGKIVSTQLPTATTAATGGVVLATNAEAVAGTDTAKAITPATLNYAVANSIPTPFTLTDAATIATDAAGRNDFRVTIAADRTLGIPTNATDGQMCLWAVTASGANRTLTLTTGSTGAFKYGTDITSIPAIVSGTTTYIGAKYHGPSSRWHVMSVAAGY